MKEYLDLFQKVSIFEGIQKDDIVHALSCMNAKVLKLRENKILFSEGMTIPYFAIVLEGELDIIKNDALGNENIIFKAFLGEVIGVSAIFSTNRIMPFDVISKTDSKILALNYNNVIKQCSNSCHFHTKIIKNMITIIANKNLQLTDKIDVLTKRTIREKILAFLYIQSKKINNEKFAVTLNRQQMADYISVNRSAMQRELQKMREENIIDFESNVFWFK